ncbi:hypothetical protein DFK10_02655 [Salibaculum griseiflavum]|uniref:Lipoprotein n=2 Tax=Salibaculum griseiflavum TaxID=1914409 RepID=A0A2V1PAS5_9RHOB|nr:hypothetical protein DFK10_02655 [Salibaculum griseiflavum]
MRRGFLLTALILTTTTGCARLADSPVNPLNWFGGGGGTQEAAAPGEAEIRPLVPANPREIVVDQRGPVETITALSVDRTPYGALVTATGQTDIQGYFNAELVPVSIEDGTLTLEFRAEAPPAFTGLGSPRSRLITVAYRLDAAELATIRTVRVTSARNSRSARP